MNDADGTSLEISSISPNATKLTDESLITVISNNKTIEIKAQFMTNDQVLHPIWLEIEPGKFPQSTTPLLVTPQNGLKPFEVAFGGTKAVQKNKSMRVFDILIPTGDPIDHIDVDGLDLVTFSVLNFPAPAIDTPHNSIDLSFNDFDIHLSLKAPYGEIFSGNNPFFY